MYIKSSPIVPTNCDCVMARTCTIRAVKGQGSRGRGQHPAVGVTRSVVYQSLLIDVLHQLRFYD